MQSTCATLFEPLFTGGISLENAKLLFLNALPFEGVAPFTAEQVVCQQHFKGEADALTRIGFMVFPEIQSGKNVDMVLHNFPKAMDEARYQIAQGLSVLKLGGMFIAAAYNDAGSRRIEGVFAEFGLQIISVHTKHKGRCVAGVYSADSPAIAKALVAYGPQPILGGRYMSQPGIFGWQGTDLGSALLLEACQGHVKGHVADFGCGYGFLSDGLARCKGVTALTCYEADYRALQAARMNLRESVVFVWSDLTDVSQKLGPFDVVVMNPPFHSGKSRDIQLGLEFIEVAARSLQPGGVLWMVANVSLPYEETLSRSFFKHQRVIVRDGFKVIRAQKA